MRPILIICTGHAPDAIRSCHGDFSQRFWRGFRLRPEQVQVVDFFAGEALPAPRDLAGAIITGSASMVTERSRLSEHCAGWVRDAMDVELPLFGVCFGHQLTPHALGGRVNSPAGGREIGTQSIVVSRQASEAVKISTAVARVSACVRDKVRCGQNWGIW
jgi:GMP synthase (glutamine-hydrolysing)